MVIILIGKATLRLVNLRGESKKNCRSPICLIHMFSFFSNNSTDKLLIESALDNTEKIVANILANANQGKRQVVLKERWVVPS